ncbi:MAG: hypothetical protein PHT83_05795, partial [Bacilli bacterium]|nr:hypothetical protein [Bacilli bacterium]
MQAVKEFFKKLFSSVSLFLKKFFSKKMNVYITIGVSVLLVGLIVGLALAKPNNPNPTDNDDDQSGIIDDEDDEVIETNYNVTVSGSGSGDVNYGGLTQVVENGSLSLEFIPTDDFYLSALNINGQEFSNDEILNAVTEGYTISNIIADVVVNYTFTLKPIVTSYTGEKIIPVANVFTIDTFDKYIWFMQVASNLGNPDITETGIASLPYSFMSKTINLEIDLDLYGFIVAPIGLGYPNRFEGTFDGKDHTIKNLKINGSYVNCALFGDTNFATIKNIVLENVDLNSSDKAAGIVAVSNNSTVTNCSVSGNIYADDYAGGIIAFGSGAKDSINYATVSSKLEAGLIYAAGITAYGSDIQNCINYGDITGYRNVGGIGGSVNNILNCANYGEITASGLVAGGIVG